MALHEEISGSHDHITKRFSGGLLTTNSFDWPSYLQLIHLIGQATHAWPCAPILSPTARSHHVRDSPSYSPRMESQSVSVRLCDW